MTNPAALDGLDPGLVVWMAGRSAAVLWGHACLREGMDAAEADTSAFAKAPLLDALRQTAVANNARVIIPPGALGGRDALATTSRLGWSTVEQRMATSSYLDRDRSRIAPPAQDVCGCSDVTARCCLESGKIQHGKQAPAGWVKPQVFQV